MHLPWNDLIVNENFTKIKKNNIIMVIKCGEFLW